MTRQILLQSLNLQHYAIGLVNECVDLSRIEYCDLARQPEQLADKKSLEFMHEAILKTSTFKLMNHVKENRLLMHQRYVLAYTYRWLDGCLINLDNKELNTIPATARFNMLTSAFQLLTVEPDEIEKQFLEDVNNSRKAYGKITFTQETEDELDELEYNNLVSFYGKELNDAVLRDATWEKLFKRAEDAKDFGRLARNYNKRHFDLPKTELDTKIIYLRKALEYRLKCANATMDEKFNLMLIRHNLASILEEKELKDWEEINTLREATNAFLIETKASGLTHPYLAKIIYPRYVEHQRKYAEAKKAAKV
jgi:hypothetical protein